MLTFHKVGWGTVERLEKALKINPGLATFRDDLANAKGYPLPFLEALGLTKMDLKKLERAGFALRGYTQNIDYDDKGNMLTGAGHKVRWVILTERPKAA